jgi:hypothetical protein
LEAGALSDEETQRLEKGLDEVAGIISLLNESLYLQPGSKRDIWMRFFTFSQGESSRRIQQIEQDIREHKEFYQRYSERHRRQTQADIDRRALLEGARKRTVPKFTC